MKNFFRNFCRKLARLAAAFIPGQRRRRCFREAWLGWVDFWFDFKNHLTIKNKFITQAEKPTILAVTHELSFTGAPLMLLAAARIFSKAGYSVFLVSFLDGPLKSEFDKINVPVLVGRCYRSHKKTISSMSQGFDLVLLNTILSAAWILFSSSPDRLLWWLHESQEISGKISEYPALYKNAVLKAKHVYAVSDYAAGFVAPYRPVQVFHQGIEDINDCCPGAYDNLAQSVRIGVVGTFGARKNQQLIIQALELLPQKYLQKIEIVFVGRQEGGYYHSVAESCRNGLPVIFAGEVRDAEQKIGLFKSMNVFCVPSCDEPFSLVVLEAMMLSKPVIVSDRVGAKSLVVDGHNGFVFPSGNAEALQEKLIWLIEHQGDLDAMGKNARATFFTQGSLESFSLELLSAVKAILPPE